MNEHFCLCQSIFDKTLTRKLYLFIIIFNQIERKLSEFLKKNIVQKLCSTIFREKSMNYKNLKRVGFQELLEKKPVNLYMVLKWRCVFYGRSNVLKLWEIKK
jgi:hypothetical protein